MMPFVAYPSLDQGTQRTNNGERILSGGHDPDDARLNNQGSEISNVATQQLHQQKEEFKEKSQFYSELGSDYREQMWRGAYGTYLLYGCGASPYTAVPAFFFGTGFTLGSSIGSVLSDSAAIYYEWRAGPDD